MKTKFLHSLLVWALLDVMLPGFAIAKPMDYSNDDPSHKNVTQPENLLKENAIPQLHVLTAVGKIPALFFRSNPSKSSWLGKNKEWVMLYFDKSRDVAHKKTITIRPKKSDLTLEMEFKSSSGIKKLILHSGPDNAKFNATIDLDSGKSEVLADITVHQNAQIQSKDAEKALEKGEEKSLKAQEQKLVIAQSDSNSLMSVAKPAKQNEDELKQLKIDPIVNYAPTIEWHVKSGDKFCAVIHKWANESGWQLSCESDMEILGDVVVSPEIKEAVTQLIKAIGPDKFKARFYTQNKMIRITDYQ